MNEWLVHEDEVIEACRSLAEHLPIDYAVHALNRFVTQRSASGYFHSAWNHVEMSMNDRLPVHTGVRESFRQDAQYLLRELVQGARSNEDARVGALTLNTYLPVFKKRADGEEITEEDCRYVYTSLGRAIEYMQPLRCDEQPHWRMSETAILALSARIGRADMLLYPTSPREEASRISRENHDHYFYEGGEKLSLQQKHFATGKEYSPHITMLILQPMLERAFARSCSDMCNVAATEQLNFVLSLIVAEAKGESLYKEEKAFMDHMCRAVARHKKEALWSRQMSDAGLVYPGTPHAAVA